MLCELLTHTEIRHSTCFSWYNHYLFLFNIYHCSPPAALRCTQTRNETEPIMAQKATAIWYTYIHTNTQYAYPLTLILSLSVGASSFVVVAYALLLSLFCFCCTGIDESFISLTDLTTKQWNQHTIWTDPKMATFKRPFHTLSSLHPLALSITLPLFMLSRCLCWSELKFILFLLSILVSLLEQSRKHLHGAESIRGSACGLCAITQTKFQECFCVSLAVSTLYLFILGSGICLICIFTLIYVELFLSCIKKFVVVVFVCFVFFFLFSRVYIYLFLLKLVSSSNRGNLMEKLERWDDALSDFNSVCVCVFVRVWLSYCRTSRCGWVCVWACVCVWAVCGCVSLSVCVCGCV